MWILVIIFSILFTMCASSFDNDQLRYLKKLDIKCGVISNDKIKDSSSRIVNARPSMNTYSWMVHISQKLYTDENFVISDGVEYGIFNAAGAFISDNAVLTCGHCICNDLDATRDWPYLFTCGAENLLGEMLENLNIKGKNEINISYGKRTKGPDDVPYNENIQAFMYKYEKNNPSLQKRWKIKRNNGDIGIVITKERLNLAKENISPICLPSPETLLSADKSSVVSDLPTSDQSGINVKFVGWGLRSMTKYDPAGEITLQSCFTNGAREPADQLDPVTGGLNIESCNFNEMMNKFCLGGEKDSNGFLQNQIQTFSYQTIIEFNSNMIDSIKKDDSFENCKKYMKGAERQWINAMKYLHSDKNYQGIMKISNFSSLQF